MFDDRFMQTWLREAYTVALDSPDLSAQVGAILISRDGYTIGRGCNNFPPSIEITPERLERPTKYRYITHAERKAIFSAAAFGFTTAGSTMVCTWGPCSDCANAVIEAGIKTFITHRDLVDKTPERWKDSVSHAFDLFKEAGIEVIFYEGRVNGPTIRHCGELWNP